ncbi:T89 [Tupaiid betaherpesvirus 1]|uniref:T89 n=1 Tax=Tupaiid herpesvirus 1 (strain 1) TaxID=10397 RepID=Q997C8_TUHV1|nr:T89 [Tupaiid betaherpesvirus 1]AAK00707.1 viral terminase [Tupaiid betaherpesvirus 1]AAK57138.1 T89 [Tupaiid betaherpesvirus 1]
MLSHETVHALRARYDELKRHREARPNVISTEFPDAATLCKKRFQTLSPELGLAHACNSVCLPLVRFCRAYRDYNQPLTRHATLNLSAAVRAGLDEITFRPCSEEQRSQSHKIAALTGLYKDPDFLQINSFLTDFRRWIDGDFDPSGGGDKSTTHIYLEPFQKNLLMHVLVFIAVTKLPVLANRVAEYLLYMFDIDFLSAASLDLFKQKATVFLVPRRHGKTWFTVPIICFLLKNVQGISIGYVAHQKHVSQFVLKEVEFRCRRLFGRTHTVENKDNVISIDHPIAKSTALFASCYNTNSIRGQNFHLLLVDEAHFIKKDAFNTILGFLAQNTTKIIFISSTNTTTDATCFLTKLNNSPFDMLNVISYVCEEHIQVFSEKPDATACPCYRLHKPTFITINSEVRQTANMFLAGSFMDEIMGGTNKIVEDTPLITDESREEFDIFRYSTMNKQLHPHLDRCLYVYLDPAFTSNKKASGTGIVALGRYREQYLIYGLEHYFLKDLLESSETAIAECAAHMLLAVLQLHPFFLEVRVTIEGNSNQAAAVRIACAIKQNILCNRHVVILFYHTPDQNEIEQPFYLLGREKRLAVESFIAKFNSGYIKASQELVSFTIKITYDPVDYLLEQLKNIQRITVNEYVTYNAKKHNCADDLAIALIMAVYLCLDERGYHFKPI